MKKYKIVENVSRYRTYHLYRRYPTAKIILMSVLGMLMSIGSLGVFLLILYIREGELPDIYWEWLGGFQTMEDAIAAKVNDEEPLEKEKVWYL